MLMFAATIVSGYLLYKKAPELELESVSAEAEKIREAVVNEVMRVAQDNLRDMIESQSKILRIWQNGIFKSIDDGVKNYMSVLESNDKNKKTSIEKKVKLSDEQLRKIDNVSREGSRIQQEIQRITSETANAFNTLLRA